MNRKKIDLFMFFFKDKEKRERGDRQTNEGEIDYVKEQLIIY